MKAIVIRVLLGALSLAVPAEARQDPKLTDARGHQVAIIDTDKREWQGRLLEVGKDALTVELDSNARQFPIDTVKRVDVEGDRVIDGVIKGALFGGVLGALATAEFRGALSGAMVYGLIGAGLDALNHCRHTVYRAPAAVARIKVSW